MIMTNSKLRMLLKWLAMKAEIDKNRQYWEAQAHRDATVE